MSQLRSDIWCSAFIRRHNDLGNLCVVARKGHAVAGQIWIEVDHLNDEISLYSPAPALMLDEDDFERAFEQRFKRVAVDKVKSRLERELEFDPDIWIIALEQRTDDSGLNIV